MHQRDPHQANHVLRAYRYQLLHALQGWLDLQNDQELLLEIDEDHAVISQERSDETQVKFSQPAGPVRGLSLRSPGVVQAIERYWARSNAGQDPRPHLKFLTNAGAAREQAAQLPDDSPGLLHWQLVAREGNLGPLRRLLIEIHGSRPVGAWLQTDPSDIELRSRLLRRVEFILEAPDDARLADHIHEQLGILYLAKRNFATLADTALPILRDRVFEAASSSDINQRRLTRLDLHAHLKRQSRASAHN